MFQRLIALDKDSYIEISTRLIGTEEKVLLALRGTKSNDIPAVASVIIEKPELENLLTCLQELLDNK